MKQYINNKLDEFNNEHCVQSKLSSYDGDYQRQWKKDYKDIHQNLWSKIMSVNDVFDYVDRYVGSVEREEKLNVTYLDIYDTDLALYRATYAIRKMAQCYDNPNCDFDTFGKDEIDNLFIKLEKTYERMKQELLRRSMND